MTNLEGKFEALETQLAAQHTELVDKLDALLEAFGVPPPTPTTTLSDIATLISLTNGTMSDIYDANATFYASMLSLTGQINTNTDIIISNNSLNAQRLIAALYATFCDCVTEAPLIAPPLDVTPTEIVDEAKCRRIQFYLSVFGNWLNKIANYGASGAAITSGTLSTLLSLAIADAGIIATGAEVGAAGGIPGVVIGAVVGLIAAVVYTLGGSVLIDYANQFNDPTLRDNMVQAMYAATNADEGYTAFKTTLLAGMDTVAAEVIYTLWWSAWSNDVYSGSPEVDDSAFDGSICVPDSAIVLEVPSSGCNTASSVDASVDGGSMIQAIDWGDGSTSNYVDGGTTQTADKRVWGGTDLYGLWISADPGCQIYCQPGGYPNFAITTTPQQITDHTLRAALVAASVPFTVTLCVDEPL